MAHLEAHLPESFEDERRKLEEEEDPNLACFAGDDDSDPTHDHSVPGLGVVKEEGGRGGRGGEEDCEQPSKVLLPAEEGGMLPQHRLLDLLQIVSFSQCDIHTHTCPIPQLF
jgi:hypothetical protein